MDTDELAALITGRKYPFEMTDDEKREARKSGLVVAYGDSDDRLEFEGAISHEFSAWRGTTVYLNDECLIVNSCCEEDCPYYEEEKRGAVELTAVWNNGYERSNNRGEPSWTIKTDIPHATFDIMEDSECQSRGIVFSMTDLAITYNK